MKAKQFLQFSVITILILTSMLPQSVNAASLLPVNDEFANAKIVNAMPYSDFLDTSLATTSPDDPTSCTSYGSVWYQFTPSVEIPISIDTFGSDYDTVLSVFTGQPYPGGLTLVECNDDTYEGLQSRASFIAKAGTTYYIMVGRYDIGEPGDNLQINVQEAPEIARPANDDFGNAKAIVTLPFSDTVDITNATPETGEITYCAPYAKTVWYTFTPTEDMWLQIDIYGSSFSDTAFTVYKAYGPNIADLNFVQCANLGNTFTVQDGFTYYIQTGSMDGNGDLQLNLYERPTNARPIAEAGGPYATFSGKSITLDASGSSDPDGDPLTYEWDLDNDGQYDDATGVTTDVSFKNLGNFIVGLKVTDTNGLSNTDTTDVIVNPVPFSVLDNFNRLDGPLGSNWLGYKSAYRILGNQVDVRSNGPIYWKDAFGVDQEVAVTLTTIDPAGKEQNLLLKVQGQYGPNWGEGAIEVLYDARTGTVAVWTFRLGTLKWFEYPAIPVAFADGDQFGAQTLSTGDVVIFKNGTEVGRVTLNVADQAFFNPRGGYIGLWFIDARNAFFDGFGGGDVKIMPPSYP